MTRELGGENFSDTLFCTLAEELSAEGWKKHEAHEKLENPLTEEERNLVGIKEAELTEVGGTGRRGAGYGGSSGLKMTGGDGVVQALSSLKEGGLVMLKIDASETIVLAEAPVEDVKTSELASHIAQGEPRYSFYKHSYNGVDGPASATVFIYTCPTASKVKDRMLYASSRRSAETLAEKEAGLKLAKKVRCGHVLRVDFSANSFLSLRLRILAKSPLKLSTTSLRRSRRRRVDFLSQNVLAVDEAPTDYRLPIVSRTTMIARRHG